MRGFLVIGKRGKFFYGFIQVNWIKSTVTLMKVFLVCNVSMLWVCRKSSQGVTVFTPALIYLRPKKMDASFTDSNCFLDGVLGLL